MRLAFVYDRINKFGGAERVLLALHQLWPQAPFFTAVHNPSTAAWSKNLKVKPSWLQRFPLAKTHHEFYPWLTPLAFESFNFKDYDVVISVTSAEAKAIITQPATVHLCYCLTPTRYLWSHRQDYLTDRSLGRWLKPVQKYMQTVDLINSSRPDIYLAISRTVQARIKKYYQRDSVVIYPPVDTQKFRPAETVADYFLVVSRLTHYKKIALAIQACNQLKKKLIIVGQGRETRRLQQLAGPTVEFLSSVKDEKLAFLYQHCQALLMPQEEDFGIVAVEAQASGRPVICFQRGGATETVVDSSGIFFQHQTVDSLVKAMKQFYSRSWDKRKIQSQAKKFDQVVFKQKIIQLVEESWQKHISRLKP